MTLIDSIKYVVDHSQSVKINNKRVDSFCQNFEMPHTVHWFQYAPFDIKTLNEKQKLLFLLVVNSLNFSYWWNPKWAIEYHQNIIDGAYGMIWAIGKAIEWGLPILDPGFLAEITERDFAHIMSGTTQIPLFYERLNILRNVWSVLLKRFHGDFSYVVEHASYDIQKLLDSIIENFVDFEDVSYYKWQKILFYKRAQFLTSDIYQSLPEGENNKWINIQILTACADYKLPMILRRVWILEYSETLAHKIDSGTEIEKWGEEEVEIRANTVWTVECIKHRLQERFPEIQSTHINDAIWLMSQEKLPNEQYHLTRTTAY